MPTEHTLAENLLRLQSATEDIADAIAEKGGTASYSDGLEAMASKILLIPTPQPILTTKSITSNGTYNASSDNADGYSSVTVNVPDSGSIIKTGHITTNGTVMQYGKTIYIETNLYTQMYDPGSSSTPRTVTLAEITGVDVPEVSDVKYVVGYSYSTYRPMGYSENFSEYCLLSASSYLSDFSYDARATSADVHLEIIRYNSMKIVLGLGIDAVRSGYGSNRKVRGFSGLTAIAIIV